MSNQELILMVIALALSIFLIRSLPVTLFANKTLPIFIQKWLTYIPPAILAALTASEILVKDGELDFSFSNLYLLAALPTFLVAYKTKSLFVTLVFGMACIAIIRLGMNYV